MKKTLFIMTVLIMLLYAIKEGISIESSIHYLLSRHKSSAPSFEFVSVGNPSGTGLPRFRWEPPEILAPPTHPPLKIMAGAHIYTIHFTTHEYMHTNQCVAFTFLNNQKIYLDIDRSPTDWKEDTLHELMHVGVAEGGGVSTDLNLSNEDRFITPTSPLLFSILRNNPRLIRWLAK